MSIKSVLKGYLASPAGKKKVADARAKALREGRTFGQPGGQIMSKQIAIQAAERMKGILLDHLLDVNISGIHADDILIGEPTTSIDGQICVDIRFSEDSLGRPSLSPSRFPEGVENIVVHLTHGWDADGFVYGHWAKAGRTVRSRRKFDGDSFMQRAVAEFNTLNLGVAELDEKYER